MNGHDLLDQVQPGFQGMLPQDPDNLNPNQQPDYLLNRKLGKPLGYNPVEIAMNRREMINEIEKAVQQLIAEALQEGTILNRPEALAKVKLIWGQQAQANPSTTLSPLPSTATSNQPLSPQAKQDFLKRTQQTNREVEMTPLEGTIPQPSIQEPALLPERVDCSPQEEANRLANEGEAFPSTPEEHQLRADLQACPPTVADIKRALLTIPDPTGEIATVEDELVATTMGINPLSFEQQAEHVSIFDKEIEATETASVIYPEGPRAVVNRDSTKCLSPEEHSISIADPVTESIFADMVQPSALEDEMQEDIMSTLHESTQQLLTFLPRRNCIQFFRQSLSMAGLPSWSRWSNDARSNLQKAYLELVADPFEVDQIVRKLQGFSVAYGKTRLLRMTAFLLGLQAWMSLEITDVR